MTRFEVRQTPCLIRGAEGLQNELHLMAEVEQACDTALCMNGAVVWQGKLEEGKQEIPFFIPEPQTKCEAVFTLADGAAYTCVIEVPRHWEVHVVQYSHHDPGYTDVPSHVLEESSRLLRQALDDMDQREDYEGDARYRIVVEQTYSLQRFLDTASPADRKRMIDRIRRGDVEVTALYANLISEILSPEEMLRAFYPAAKIAEETGVPVIAAEHNDIPGFSWGYCTALCRAGIRFFVPGLPEYYFWGNKDLSSFWDTEKIFGDRLPGAFWWESPEGDRLLFWSGNRGCGGSKEPDMPNLVPFLQELEQARWPHRVLRWVVQSSNRDNSPYTPVFADHIRRWNETYAWPHLICSTETAFYNSFTQNLSVELPVYRGGVDGQDYPVASTCQMSSSAVSRETHALYRQAEFLYSLARGDEKMYDQSDRLHSAVRDMLMADEHAYGFTYPASKGHRASFWEHGTYAMRANADAHDVLAKSMASLSDRVRSEHKGYRLTVFNTSGTAGLFALTAPLRDPDNCGTEVHQFEEGGPLYICELSDRFPVSPQDELLQGKFRLLDAESGEEVPFVLKKVSWDDPDELSALRAGIGAGTNRMGFFEDPAGASLEMHFTLELPAYGYRTLLLEPCERAASFGKMTNTGAIQNEYYRIRYDDSGLLGITDLTDGTELFDEGTVPCTLLVRYGNERETSAMRVRNVCAEVNGVESTLTIRGEADGIYEAVFRFTLAKGIDGVKLDVRVVKNEKPLQSVFLAFPFRGGGLRYQGAFYESRPAENLMPGSHSDFIAVQDWVWSEESDILWNSANAPMVALSHLWEGYISPAHRCIFKKVWHEPLTMEQYDTAHIYSLLTCNNFGTNFFPSQLSSANFTYTFAKRHGREPSAWGAAANLRPVTLLTDRSRGTLPLAAELLSAPGVRVLALKPAEDGNGLVLRLKNDSLSDVVVPVTVWGKPVNLLNECDAVERAVRPLSGHIVTVPAGKLMTLRFTPEE